MPGLMGNGMVRIIKIDAACLTTSTTQVAIGGAIIRGIFTKRASDLKSM